MSDLPTHKQELFDEVEKYLRKHYYLLSRLAQVLPGRGAVFVPSRERNTSVPAYSHRAI